MQNGLRAKVHCFGKEHVCLGDDDCPGDDVFQLSDISRPFVCIEALQGLVRNLGDIAPVLGGVFSEEVASQQHGITTVSYTHLRAHETRHDLVCRLLLEKKKKKTKKKKNDSKK